MEHINKWMFKEGDVVFHQPSKVLYLVICVGDSDTNFSVAAMPNCYTLKRWNASAEIIKNKDICHKHLRLATATEQVLYGQVQRRG